MKNKSDESINIIDRLCNINRIMYKTKIITENEYDSHSDVFLNLLFSDKTLSSKQIQLINSNSIKRLCVTKFRLCMNMLQFNSN